ncbi:hypothetical protein PLESTB_000429700 [Pleodorina starrii]|uniref:Protein kinase domain-containing protein n=1 Tax=Pleodorina starrii TaxID=330485 RepID=A0A9W6BFR9_9CHLO|nr:hypothetical protein PLESTM_001694200 [Pleodorina starrii]GLC50767.1 hypothetical protein PLESTB_000429700 [Pleodorina starrii]GLC74325.1 hypothetical protein PLESTF_001499700 [Pleodorina starrii]
MAAPNDLRALSQRLRIGKRLGSGAFAVVHQATYDGQPVALKVLLPGRGPSSRDDCPVKMFIREGQLLQCVNHSNLVRCLAVLELPPDFPGLPRGYTRPTWGLVLELLGGGSLCGLLHKQLLAPWKFLYDNATALAWSCQVAGALAHLHGLELPVLHRDIKAENIMLTAPHQEGRESVAKLVDLGLHSRPVRYVESRNSRKSLLRASIAASSTTSSCRSLLRTKTAVVAAAAAATSRRPMSLPCNSASTGPDWDIDRDAVRAALRSGIAAAVAAAADSTPSSTAPPGVDAGFTLTSRGSDGSLFFELLEQQSSGLCAAGLTASREGGGGGGGGAAAAAAAATPGVSDRGTLSSRPPTMPRLLSFCTTPPLPPPPEGKQQGAQGAPPRPPLPPPPPFGTSPSTPALAPARVNSIIIQDGDGSFALMLGHPPPAGGAAAAAALPADPPAEGSDPVVGQPPGSAVTAANRALPSEKDIAGGVPTACSDPGASRAAGGNGGEQSPFASAFALQNPPTPTPRPQPPQRQQRPARVDASSGGRGGGGGGVDSASSCSTAVTAFTTFTATVGDIQSSTVAAFLVGDSGPCDAVRRGSQEKETTTARLESCVGGGGGGVGGAAVAAARRLYDSAAPEGRAEPVGAGGGGGAKPTEGRQLSYGNRKGADGEPRRAISASATSATSASNNNNNNNNGLRLARHFSFLAAQSGAAGEGDQGLNRVGTCEVVVEVVYCLTGETGSFMTMAPEIKLRQPYNEKVDVYAFGVVLYEIWSRSLLKVSYIGTRRPDLPYIVHRCEDWPALVAGGFRPARCESIPGPVWELISECWHTDPLARPSMAEVEARLVQMGAEQAEEVVGLASGKGGRRLRRMGAGEEGVGEGIVGGAGDAVQVGGNGAAACRCTIS